jgi:fimbrial chaperone protein
VRLRHLLLAAAGAIALGGRPRAANLEISPVFVELGKRTPSATVTVRNGGATPVRYQVSAMAWTEAVAGEPKLTPATDLAAFPPLFALGPGEERKIRVGATVPPGAEERAWRLFVEELPEPTEAKGGAQIAIRTRFALAVFQAPVTPKPLLVLSLNFAGGKVMATLRNAGNVHVRPTLAAVTFLGAPGEKLHVAEVSPAVLLPATERTSDVAVPQELCAKVRMAVLTAEIGDAKVEETLKLPDGACAR